MGWALFEILRPGRPSKHIPLQPIIRLLNFRTDRLNVALTLKTPPQIIQFTYEKYYVLVPCNYYAEKDAKKGELSRLSSNQYKRPL